MIRAWEIKPNPNNQAGEAESARALDESQGQRASAPN